MNYTWASALSIRVKLGFKWIAPAILQGLWLRTSNMGLSWEPQTLDPKGSAHISKVGKKKKNKPERQQPETGHAADRTNSSLGKPGGDQAQEQTVGAGIRGTSTRVGKLPPRRCVVSKTPVFTCSQDCTLNNSRLKNSVLFREKEL